MVPSLLYFPIKFITSYCHIDIATFTACFKKMSRPSAPGKRRRHKPKTIRKLPKERPMHGVHHHPSSLSLFIGLYIGKRIVHVTEWTEFFWRCEVRFQNIM